ncbi:MAG: glycoside hydrolase family 38 C-terminal domain-containing protein [Thermoproteota archaeon]
MNNKDKEELKSPSLSLGIVIVLLITVLWVMIFLFFKSSFSPPIPYQFTTFYYFSKAKVVLFLVPYSHWDPDWWMPWNESSKKVRNIISNGLSDLARYDNLTFVTDTLAFDKYFFDHSSEAERNLFREFVKEHRISLAGGMVTEPDTNLVTEPGIVWDIFLGHKWVNDTLCIPPSVVAMQCDPFGHSPSLPIILSQAGYKYLYIGRVGQNQELPLIFWWTSPIDNSTKILTYNLGYWKGDFLRSTTDPYAIEQKLLDLITRLKERTSSKFLLLLVGNDFVGFSNTIVDLANNWNKELFDKTGILLVVDTPEDFFATVQQYEGSSLPKATVDINPLWQGFYGTRPEAKISERLSEYYLTTFDKYLLVARYFNLLSENQIENLINKTNQLKWLASMNHHHDTITGTSPDSTWLSSQLPRFKLVENESKLLFESILSNISAYVAKNDCYQIVVFNPTSHYRSEIVSLKVKVPLNWNFVTVRDSNGSLPTQTLSKELFDENNELTLAFPARDIPPIGYKAFTLCNSSSGVKHGNKARIRLKENFIELNNGLINLTISLINGGTIESLAYSGFQFLRNGSNEVFFYHDVGGAYSMRITKTLYESQDFKVSKFNILQNGSLIASVELEVEENNLKFNETYTIYSGLPFVDVSLYIRALPDTTLTTKLYPAFLASKFLNHVSFGVVERPIDTNFWPVNYWATLENGKLGVAIINFGEQGIRAKDFNGNQVLEFMLVRDGSRTNAPEGGFSFSDLEFHNLTYRIFPYLGNWKVAELWKYAYDYNFPLIAKFETYGYNKLPKSFSLFSSNSSELVDIIPLSSNLDRILVVTSNYNSTLKVYSGIGLGSVYSSFIDGRIIKEIKTMNSKYFEVDDVKFLEAYVVCLHF